MFVAYKSESSEIDSEGFPYGDIFSWGREVGGRWEGVGHAVVAVAVVAAAPPEIHDGESSQNGNMVFQKC